MRKLLQKEGLKQFFDGLLRDYEVIAPIKKKSIHLFEKVDSFEQMDLDFINTAYSAKRFLLPVIEELFKFKGNKIDYEVDNTKRVIFGIRPCDVNAFQVIDRIYLDEHEDEYYKARRDNTLIISLECLKAGPNCFCGSFGTNKLEKGFDLLFTETEQGYAIKVGSEKGKALVQYLPNTELEPEIELRFEKEITPEMLDNLRNNFDNPIWEKEAENCLSCGACTTTCPTCACFFVRDEPNLDVESGTRMRCWASCQLKNFTKVAGNHVFREERGKRLKHRIFHQLIYYEDKFHSQMCVGCGRCFTNCPTEIDMVKIIGKLT